MMAGFKRKFLAGFASCCPFATPRDIPIHNWKLTCTNWLIFLGIILAWTVGYEILWQKGYQEYDDVISSVSTKLQGVAYPNRPDIDPALDRVWDTAELVVPPQQRDGFFVMTNMIITPDQSQGTCAEAPWVGHNVSCTDSETRNCPAGKVEISGSGMFTGKCANFNGTVKTCEIRGWCPVEQQRNPPSPAVLEGAKEFTILLKNTISFPKFRFTKRNILDDSNPDYLKNCRFDNSDPKDKYCPIFKLDTIVKEANQNFTALAEQGGIIGIHITWDCNLNFDASYCLPKYFFTRLDKADSKVSPGYNFRHARYYKQNDINYRTLIKAYGIRFDVLVSGQGGKYSSLAVGTKLAAGYVFYATAGTIINYTILYFYRKKKMEVDEDKDGDLLLMSGCRDLWKPYCTCSCCTCCNGYDQMEDGTAGSSGTRGQADEETPLVNMPSNVQNV
ncbi:P2X purinoceptor 4-like isoform X2 [Branchiostoma floridae x Branchiostoma japonicum]